MVKPKPKPLPAKFVILLGRWVWSTMWHVMMSQMAPRSQSGEYLRPESQFRGTEFLPEIGRYRLLVGMGCPWAHRMRDHRCSYSHRFGASCPDKC